MLGLNYNSLGKAILADLTPAEVKKHLDGPLIQYTPNTITNYDEMMKHLETVRKEGVAIDDEEGFEGIRGIAATIKNEKK